MKQKKAEAVSIIGGADGPTSIFMVGSFDKKKSLKERIRQSIYRFRRKRAEKKIYADPHTLKETVAYACEKYYAAEIPKTQRRYTEQYASAKEGLIIMHKPELLGSLGEITWPDTLHEKSPPVSFCIIQLFLRFSTFNLYYLYSNTRLLLKKELLPVRNERQYPRLQMAHFRKPRYFLYRAA